jgi:hypothetical protein
MKAMKNGGLILCCCLILSFAFATVAWAADGASYVTETYTDGTSVAGGTSFTKTWTIKNSGTTTWNSGYKLRWVSGSLSPSHTDIPISGTVSPGGSYTFRVNMKAPAAQSSTMSYKEDWKFINPSSITIKVGSSLTLWASIKVPGNMVAGWSDATGYRHSETTKQRAIVAAALSGGNGRPSPQSVIGSPWQTDTAGGDGGRMRLAIQDVYNYWVANKKPSLPLATIPATVQATMRNRLAATYPLAQQNAFVERIRRVFNGTVPTTDDGTLTYLGIRAQCKEFADRMVQSGGGAKKSYGSAAVAMTNIRPGMYAFKNGNGHAAIIVAVYWGANGQPTQLRLAESNWGVGWNNPLGQVPWERIITTGRTVPISDYYVVATE